LPGIEGVEHRQTGENWDRDRKSVASAIIGAGGSNEKSVKLGMIKERKGALTGKSYMLRPCKKLASERDARRPASSGYSPQICG